MLTGRPGTGGSRGAVVCAAVLLLSGCSAGPVEIVDQGLTGAAARKCRALVDDLPQAIGDRDRVPVTPPDALGAAWGDPAIVLTCGTGVPEEFDRTAVCEEANGVGWFVPEDALDDESIDVTMSTAGYRPVVQVVVPADERPEGVAAAMATLADDVSAHTDLVRPCH